MLLGLRCWAHSRLQKSCTASRSVCFRKSKIGLANVGQCSISVAKSSERLRVSKTLLVQKCRIHCSERPELSSTLLEASRRLDLRRMVCLPQPRWRRDLPARALGHRRRVRGAGRDVHGEGLVRHRGGLQLLHRAAAVLEAHADLSICVEIFSAVTICLKFAEKVKSAVRRSSALESVLGLAFPCCKPMEFGLRCAWCEKNDPLSSVHTLERCQRGARAAVAHLQR